MPTDTPDIHCSKCKRGSLLLVGRAGRQLDVDGASVEVPPDFMIPTCDRCGAEHLDNERKSSLFKSVANARVATLRSARTDQMRIHRAAITRGGDDRGAPKS